MQEDRVLQSEFARALKALSEGAETAATEIAQDMLKRWPEEAGVHQLMAAMALTRSKAAEAERWAVSSLSRRPDHAPTLILAARAARLQGNWRAAWEYFHRAEALEPTRPEAAFGAAMARLHLDPAEVPAVLASLRLRFAEASPHWVELGAALELMSRPELAVEIFEASIPTQPSAKAYTRFGSALHALGRRGEAAEVLQKALHLDPSAAEAWFKLGLTLQDARDFARAAQAYRRALELRPTLAEAQANLGVVMQEQGDLEEAKQAYGRAIALMPSAFGRIAQALTTSPKGELWLDLAALRSHLSELGRLSR